MQWKKMEETGEVNMDRQEKAKKKNVRENHKQLQSDT